MIDLMDPFGPRETVIRHANERLTHRLHTHRPHSRLGMAAAAARTMVAAATAAQSTFGSPPWSEGDRIRAVGVDAIVTGMGKFSKRDGATASAAVGHSRYVIADVTTT